MKKTLLSISLLVLGSGFSQTADFENLTLAPESYYSGADMAGEFNSGGVIFKNEYDPGFGGYWSGAFVYSNSTDVTTAGYTNGQSAFLSNPSATGNIYAAFYQSWNGATVDFGTPVHPVSMKVTNVTYTAISMRDGDAYGKQFGSVNNAQGQADGTNGEDFFLLHIIGLDQDSLVIDTVDFYLADYRFADNQQDYIVSDWSAVDLAALDGSRYFAFAFESSDNGQFGMNTPAYFAMDDLTFTTPLGIPETARSFSVFPNPATDKVFVQSDPGIVSIVDANGRLIFRAQTNGYCSIATESLSAGSYIVEIQNETGTGRQHLIKR